MIAVHHYKKAFSAEFPELLTNKAQAGLFTQALEIDRLADQVADSARRAARDLNELAANYDEGRCYTSNPLGSSSLYDLPMLIAARHAKVEAFWHMFYMLDEEAANRVKKAMGVTP